MFALCLVARESDVDAVSDALMDELGARSVSVEDADAGTEHEHALFGEPGMPAPAGGWQRSVVTALFDTEAEATEAATLLLAHDWPGGLRLRSVAAVEDRDWVRLTQSQFAPVAVTDDFWIVPSWHEPPAAATRVIRLDPGLAFGTGTHPTTRMCLRWLATQAATTTARWDRALDYGCGSGILAIGAALFGARGIDAVDIDPAAVASTATNAQANGVALHAGTPETARGVYPLVVANILATPLKLLAPLLCGHVAAGGDLVLAGILERQTDELEAAYAPWIALHVADLDDGWVLMCGTRPAA